ncbi:SPOR domain-containing protein [Magnetofaba australis]|nr:SPOR domain-containing protein [Magnetofaba australis]
MQAVMKAPYNREQQLLLAAGGGILAVVFGVVAWQMVMGPSTPEMSVKDVTPKPVVIRTDTDAAREGRGNSWLAEMKKAPIFSAQPARSDAPAVTEPSNVIVSASSDAATDTDPIQAAPQVKPPEDILGKWARMAGLDQDEPKPADADAASANYARADNQRYETLNVNPMPVNPEPARVGRTAPGKAEMAPAQTPSARETPAHIAFPGLDRLVQQKAAAAAPVAMQPAAQRPEVAPKAMPRQTAAAPTRTLPKPTPFTAAAKPHFTAPSFGAPRVTKAATPATGFSVQVGAFSDAARANALKGRLASLPFQGDGLAAFVMPVKSGARTIYRVRLGPFADRGLATSAMAYVRKQAGVKGTMIAPGR